MNPEEIKGIGFDATCSLVALDTSGNPLSVSPTGTPFQYRFLSPTYHFLGHNDQNVILWMDHRAAKEASKINALNHSVLKYVGGKISLEMETPKLLWLKTHLKTQWDKSGLFFDLPDFLTWKATNCESRSLCSLVCKWTYEITTDGKEGWNSQYFQDVGLGDLQANNWRKIGTKVLPPGSPVGDGLSLKAAGELGLKVGTPVGTSIIDAHAGGLGLVGCRVPNISEDFSTRLGTILV